MSSLLASAASRSVPQRGDAVRLRERLELVGVAADQDRVGHDLRRRSSSATPPCARIAQIERIRCWFVPMRPVTPFMMMPSASCRHASFLRCRMSGSGERFAHAAQVAGGERRRSPGRRERSRTARPRRRVVAVALQRREDRRERIVALAGRAPVRVVDLHVPRSARSAASASISSGTGTASVERRRRCSRSSSLRAGLSTARTTAAASATVLIRPVSARRSGSSSSDAVRARRPRAASARNSSSRRARRRVRLPRRRSRAAQASRARARCRRARRTGRSVASSTSSVRARTAASGSVSDRPAGLTSSQCRPVTTRPARSTDAAHPLRLGGVDAIRRIGERERRDLEAS